jgi:hypothetical protein
VAGDDATRFLDEPRSRFVQDAASRGLNVEQMAGATERAWEQAHPEGRVDADSEHWLVLWNFGIGEATPKPEHRAALAHFIATWRSVTSDADFHVVGYSSVLSVEAGVSGLPLERAEAVAFSMGIGQGVPLARIKCAAVADPRPLPLGRGGRGEALAWERRVEIKIVIPSRGGGEAREDVPKIPDLMPFDDDERLAWAFLKGLGTKDLDVDAIVKSLESSQAKIDFGMGLAKGAYQGAKSTLDEASKSFSDLINWTMEFYSTVYDPALLRGIMKTWATAPDTPGRTKALLDLADLYQERHPAGSAAMSAIAEAIVALEALAEWLREPGALFQILMALSRLLGEVLAEERDLIRSRVGKPEALGFLVGDTLGQVVMTLALALLGIPL